MWFIVVLLVLTVVPCLGQRASLERQRASVQRQRVAAHPVFLNFVAAVRPRSACEAVPPMDLDRMIGAAARANRVSAKVVREVARQESGFQPCARSPKGAQGLMQLMPATQATLGVENPFDPQESLMAGARLLKDLLGRYNGNLSLALSAYNAGPARVDAIRAIPAIPETRNYVSTILSRLTE